MADTRQPGTPQGAAPTCAECEPQFAELLEGTLPAAEAERVQRHVDSCTACKAALDASFRGKAWLAILRDDDLQLTPSPDFVSKILAATAGEKIPAAIPAAPAAKPAPWANINMAAVKRSVWYQPRLILTAAMAFFSVSLTMAVTGVRPADLKPTNIRHTVTRQYYQANAHVVRYYESLRVVYQLESRVRELRRAAETQPAQQQQQPQPAPQQKTSHNGKGGSSRRQEPAGPAGLAHGHPQSPASNDPQPAPASSDLLEARLNTDWQAPQRRAT